MANRYAVAAGGNWTATGTWSTTDGGAGGASVPTTSDDVFLTSLSGSVVVNATASARNLDCTGYTNTLSSPTSSINLQIAGELFRLSGSMSLTFNGNLFFTATSTAATVQMDFAGKFFPGRVDLNGSSDTFELISAVSCAGEFEMNNETAFYSNGYPMQCASLESTGSIVRTVDLTGSDITLTETANGSVIDFNTTNLTFLPPASITYAPTSPPGVMIFNTGGLVIAELIIDNTTYTPNTSTIFRLSSGSAFSLISFIDEDAVEPFTIELYGPVTIGAAVFPFNTTLGSTDNTAARTLTVGSGQQVVFNGGGSVSNITVSTGNVVAYDTADAGGNTGVTFTRPFVTEVTGVVYDNSGTPVEGADVFLFKEVDGALVLVDQQTSAVTTGEYTCQAWDTDATYVVVAYTSGGTPTADAMYGIQPITP